MKKHLRAHFFGNVQGVGFRYTAAILAQELKLKGTAKNLEDGTVLVEVEGQENLIQEFLERIKKNFSANILNIKLDFSKNNNQYQNFKIVD